MLLSSKNSIYTKYISTLAVALRAVVLNISIIKVHWTLAFEFEILHPPRPKHLRDIRDTLIAAQLVQRL